MSQRAKRRWFGAGVAVLAVGAGAFAAKGTDSPATRGLGEPTKVAYQREAYAPATLAEVATLADVVAEGTVADIRLGPKVEDGTDSFGYLVMTVDVNFSFFGTQRGEQLEVLMTGYDPSTGETMQVEGSHRLQVGTTGIWYLRGSELDAAPNAYFVATSAGEIVRGEDGLAMTGGDQQAAAQACGLPWDVVRAAVSASVESRPVTASIEPGKPSPALDDSFAGNPCAPEAVIGPEEGPISGDVPTTQEAGSK